MCLPALSISTRAPKTTVVTRDDPFYSKDAFALWAAMFSNNGSSIITAAYLFVCCRIQEARVDDDCNCKQIEKFLTARYYDSDHKKKASHAH